MTNEALEIALEALMEARKQMRGTSAKAKAARAQCDNAIDTALLTLLGVA